MLQTLGGAPSRDDVEGAEQTLASGPVASQIAIKQLGTNGGGFFNVNSAMPFENPTVHQLRRAALDHPDPGGAHLHLRAHGRPPAPGLGDLRAMLAITSSSPSVVYPPSSTAPRPSTPPASAPPRLRLDRRQHGGQGAAQRDRRVGALGDDHDGHLQRLGRLLARLYTGLGGAVAMFGAGSSEVVFGGVGTGLYSMLLFVLLAVFIGGLMVGRTPEYLGQEDPGTGDQADLARRALHPAGGPGHTGLAIGDGRQAVDLAGGPQGFSETLYAYLSQANNNGSAFAGYTGFVQPNAPGNDGAYGITFADLLGGATMTLGALHPDHPRPRGRRLARRQEGLAGRPGTMRTDTPTFVILLVGVVILVGALTFFPALLLGPIVQSLTTRLF